MVTNMQAQFTPTEDTNPNWKVVKLDDEGNWQTLASGLTYKQADDLLDEYFDEHPNAIVDVIVDGQEPFGLIDQTN